ncbi:MAG: ChbG/HpnK family deacetylase [Desulfobacteraceae bacterium]|jgi:predicted glycoside hydrolase/deacetylase ChbG (UPF0249 family)
MSRKHLIVNADDYGLCREISLGILRAYNEGVVTAVSVVSVGRYFKEGLNALSDSELDIGVHLTFVDQEKSLTGPIKGLTNPFGIFHKDKKQVIPRIVLGAFDYKALETELYAQTERIAAAGLPITHIDAHQHLHLLPGITQMVLDIARHYKIPWVRIPQSRIWDIKGSGLNLLGRRLRWISTRMGLRQTDYCLGFDHSGHTHQKVLMELLNRVEPGITELIMHPGLDASHRYDWKFEWQNELAALTSNAIKHRMDVLDIQLTNFSGVS